MKWSSRPTERWNWTIMCSTCRLKARILGELFYNHVLPAAIHYQNQLLENVNGLKEVYGAAHKKVGGAQLNMIEQIGEHLTEAKKLTDAMMDAKKRTDNMGDIAKKAKTYCDTVKPYF